MNIIKDFISKGRRNRPGYSMTPKFVTIHNTGNKNKGADAAMHARYIKNLSGTTSWHFTVDDKSIYQHIPTNENAWHAGDGKYGTGNRQSIGIEICMNEGIDQLKAEENAAKLTAYLLKLYNLNISAVKKHQDWSGKYCPSVLISSGRWNEFISDVQKYLNGNKGVEEMPINYPGLLKRGDAGVLVKNLQIQLTKKGFKTSVDGHFGPITEAMVKSFQKANGLEVDGLVGPNTFSVLFKPEPKPEPQKPSSKPSNDHSNWKLNELQWMCDKGFINDFNDWKDDIEKTMPMWAILTIMRRMYEDLKK